MESSILPGLLARGCAGGVISVSRGRLLLQSRLLIPLPFPSKSLPWKAPLPKAPQASSSRN